MDAMLERMFIEILNMSLTACIVIAAVLIARLFLKKLPRVFSYALWAVVLFRLLCPVSFTAPFSLLGVLQNESAVQGRMEYIPQDIGYQADPQIALPLPALNETVNRSLPAGNPAASVNPLQVWLYIGSHLWALGILVILLYSGFCSLRLHRRLQKARRLRDNLYRLPGGGTPFVCGLIRPRIYVPDSVDIDRSDYIVLHEQTHIRRGDHIFRLLAYLALCLHWFNPLVWLAFSLSSRDMEMSCDEAVLRKIGSKVKKDYSASLLALSAANAEIRGVPLAFGEKEPKSRIKNVLRYKKPAAVLLIVAALICIPAAFFLLGNPESKEQKTGEVYYGIVMPPDGGGDNIVFVPGLGEMAIPQAETVEPYIEMDFDGLEAGQLLRITFPADKEITIMESFPGQFSSAAESIEVMGVGFGIQSMGDGNYLFSVPLGMAPDAKEGDILRIYHSVIDNGSLQELYHLYALDSLKSIRTELLAETRVSSVNADSYDIWVVLSPQEVNTFLSEFGFGLSCELEKPEEEDTGESILRLTPEIMRSGEVPDGTYLIYPRSLSRSLRGFDRFVVEGVLFDDDIAASPLSELLFADDCVFMVNREIDKIRYEEIDFDEFAELTDAAFSWINPTVRCVFQGGLITEASLLSANYGAGITYETMPEDDWYVFIGGLEGLSSEEMLEKYYTLVRTEDGDMDPPVDRVEIYTGNIGDGDSGIVLFYDDQGNLLGTSSAHHARAGWNNIYLGRVDGADYVMTVHIENRDDYGAYDYQVYWFDEKGNPLQIAGSSFTFGDNVGYDDKLFANWVGQLQHYLAHSHLLLSSQEGEIRTDPVSEADKYNYETLKP